MQIKCYRVINNKIRVTMKTKKLVHFTHYQLTMLNTFNANNRF